MAKGITSQSGLVFKSVWLGIAVVLYIAGIILFLQHKNFLGWLLWGGCCMFPMIGKVVREAFSSAKKGVREGANKYTATVTSTGVMVRNRPFREGLISLVASIVLPF